MSQTLASRKHNVLAVVATVAVLALLAGLTWRTVYYARLIQTGQLTRGDLAFLDAYSPSTAAAATPLPQGEIDVTSPDDPSIGSPDAKVTIVEFADFGCPYSRESSFVVRSLAQKYGDDVHFIYRDFPIVELHTDAEIAAEAGECADEQGKFWEYHDKLYLNQTDLSEDHLIDLARETNLDVAAFTYCLKSGRYEKEVEEDMTAGVAAGVHGTPTFFINGNRIPGAIPENILDALIQRAL